MIEIIKEMIENHEVLFDVSLPFILSNILIQTLFKSGKFNIVFYYWTTNLVTSFNTHFSIIYIFYKPAYYI